MNKTTLSIRSFLWHIRHANDKCCVCGKKKIALIYKSRAGKLYPTHTKCSAKAWDMSMVKPSA